MPCPAVPQNGPEVEQRPARGARWARRQVARHDGRGDGEGGDRGDATEREGGARPAQGVEQAGGGEGDGARDADPCGMPGDGARLRRPLQWVGNGLATDHVSARPADARQRPHQQPRPEAVGHEGEAEVRERG